MFADAVRSHLKPASSSYSDVEVELTLLVFRGLLPTTVLAIVSVPGLTAALSLQYHDRFLAFQTLVIFTICALRMAVVYNFTRIDPTHLKVRKARRWQALYGSVTFIYCCLMSVTTYHTYRFHSYQGGWVCALGVFCVCIALASRSGMRPWVIQACGSVLLLTLAVCITRNPLPMRWAALALIVMFFYQFSYALQNQFKIAVEQLRIRRKLHALSEQDVLTGLANRRHFEASLATLCASRELFAILYIDLDRFKHVNDKYGHATGDTLLIEVAQRLRSTIRPTDLLARLGGDEFAILQTPLLSADAKDSAKALAARINTDISRPFRIGCHEVGIGASIGIRLSESGQTDADTLLSKADQALYLVKQSGGGSFNLAAA